jgi:hypothetical protein
MIGRNICFSVKIFKMAFELTIVKVPRLIQVTPATCEPGIHVLQSAYEGEECGR